MALKREAVIRSAEKYVSKGKLEAGIKEYRKVLAENPNDINTLNRVGDLYARIERYDEAVRLFSQIAEQYTRDGFFVKAIAIYKKIIKLDPTALTVYERLAELYHKQGLLTEARTQYQVLADYYQKHDNATSAITIYQRMSELEPDNPTFHLKLAELYQSQRLTDKAVREYRQLADLMIVNGSVEEAVQVYLKALEIGADNLEFVREAVGGLHESGHTSAAARVLAKAVDLNPDAARITSQVGLDQGPAFGAADAEDADAVGEADVELTSEAVSSTLDVPLEPAAGGFADDAFALDAETSFDFDLEVESDDDVVVQPTADTSASTDPSFGDLDDAFADFGSDDSSRVEIDLDPVGETDDAVGIEMNAEDDEVFTFDLEDDEIPASMVQPPADVTDDTAAGWAADAGALVGPSGADAPADDAFEFEIDLEDSAGLDATGGLGEVGDLGDDTLAVQEAADAIGSDFASPATGYRADEPARAFDDAPTGEEAIEIDWSSDAMTDLDTDLDSELGGAMDEPVLAEPALAEPDELTLEIEPPELDPPTVDLPVDDLGAFEIELEDPGDATVFAGSAPAFADPSAGAWSNDAPAAPRPDAEPDQAAGDDEAPSAVRREEDLVAEAKVFAKYGLREKALDRLEELLESYPRHLEGLALRIRLDLEAGRNEAVIERAARLAELSREDGEDEPWATLRQELLDAGFSVDGDQVLAGDEAKPVAVAGEDDRIAQLLEDLSLDSFEDSTASLDETAFESLLDATSTGAKAAASPSPPPPPVTSEVDAEADQPADDLSPDDLSPADEPQETRRLISLVDELGLDDLDDDLDEIDVGEGDVAAIGAGADMAGDATLATSPPPPPAMPESLDETGMSWLDDAPVVAEAPSASTETIFDEEDDFFDLAAELEAELGPSGDEIDLRSVSSSMEPQEQSLEEIIEGFKQGVAENLSPEDYDTHFNLGIAYREMGLMDEAIGEFQLASKDPRYLVDSASMLGICFLEKGLPELAVRWYRKALEAPGLTEDGTLGLLYDMGDAYVSMGDADAAYRTFVEIYGMNTNFRDVSARIQDLAPQQT